jgi:hypothetical protein|tara:strand:- start:382 stop:1722 length:1341 start_codon:yes stop_codon:yes gene_type:complete
MKKLLLILTIFQFLTFNLFSQDCEEPKLPSWDKEKYTYMGDFVNSGELKNFFICYKEYIKCQKQRRLNDTLRLQTKLQLPTIKELKDEIKFDEINLKDITTKDVVDWGKKNLFTNVELSFGGFVSRPKDFADLTIPDDYVYSFGIRKKASESCLTCPENIFGRKEEDLKKDEEKESHAFNMQGMQYKITWDFIRVDGREYSESRQYGRYTKIFNRYGFWLEADHKDRVNALIEDYGSNQEFVRGGLRVLYRVNQNVNLTFGYNLRGTPWASYTDEFIGFYKNTYWDTTSTAQNVFYDFNGNSEWENDELVGTYTEILDPVLNEPYITNEFNAKKRIWAWTGSPVIGIDYFSESELYFLNVFANFYPQQTDLSVPGVATVTSGNDVEIKAFGMEADWAPTENVFEYDGGIEAGIKLGKKFTIAISGEISNYYGVQDYKTTVGIKYKL